jgi:hypothetical protein
MAIEKAFAIKGTPTDVWMALTGDLQLGDSSTYEIERAIANQSLSLWVQLQGGIRARLVYTLIAHEDHTEVAATMEPEGFRYAVLRILSFGRADTNYEIALVEGLANLKRSVEGKRDSLPVR